MKSSSSLRVFADRLRNCRSQTGAFWSALGKDLRQGRSRRDMATGLRLRQNLLEWTTLREGKHTWETLAAGQVPLAGDENLMTDAAKLGAEIRRQCPNLSGPISLGLSSERMLLRIVDLPSTDPGEMAAMIKLQLDKFSPFPEEKMAFSYELLKTTESSSRVLIAAVHKDAIDFASAVCAHAGLDLQRIDAAMLGLGRVLADQGEIPAAGRQLLLLLEAEGGILLAAQAGALAAIKTIGSSSGLSAEEYAAEVVHEVGAFILALDLEQGVAPVNGLDFWQRDLAPDLLAERLQTELGQEARVRSLDALPAVSVGLARRMLRPPFKLAAAPGRQISAGVDLVPAVWRAAESARSVQRRIIAASILLLGLWLTAFLGFLGGYAWQQNALTTMEQRLKTLKDQADEVRAIQKRVRILEQYLDRKRSALECVGEISGLLPEGVTITGFQFKKAKNISLRGEALSVDPIYDFKQALDKSKLFTKIDLGSVTPSKRNNTTIQTFQMTIHQPEDQL